METVEESRTRVLGETYGGRLGSWCVRSLENFRWKGVRTGTKEETFTPVTTMCRVSRSPLYTFRPPCSERYVVRALVAAVVTATNERQEGRKFL